MTTTVKVISAVYVPAGETFNGEILTEAKWLRVDEVAELSDDFAILQSQNGQVDIVAIDGNLAGRGACCC